jgi:hypothetical protein
MMRSAVVLSLALAVGVQSDEELLLLEAVEIYGRPTCRHIIAQHST